MTQQVVSNKFKRIAKRTAIGLAVLLLFGLAISWYVAGQLVAPHRTAIGLPPDDMPIETISLESESGATLSGWHIRREASSAVIVLLHPLLHPLRGSRLDMLERARFLHRAGYSLVMLDLQAHGESSGNQITVGHLEQHDVSAAVDFAIEQHPSQKVGVLGISLGGASALLASPINIDALVLESVFPDIERAIHNRVSSKLGLLAPVPTSILLAQLKPRLGVEPANLRPIDHLEKVGCPVFVISGKEDPHTTKAETVEMYDLATEPKELWLVERAGHVDLHSLTPEEYQRRVLSFFEKHVR